ncbi:hypothetical protein E2C11_16450 [Streptomyces lavendulae]|nr:hypothetical protein [Streptomyces lavendulae]TXJ78597.1 hypothetical protein E2C11_16450 [Streptomyces lavendulae]
MTDQLQQRIAQAVDRVFEQWTAGLGNQRPQGAITAAVLAEVKPELDRLADHAKRLTQLEELLQIAHETSNRSEAERARAVERAERAEAAITRVQALHQQYRFAGDDTTDYCAHCNQISGGWVPWPCPTTEALTPTTPKPSDA